MNKLYYLSSCSTCKKIIKQWSLNQSISLIDVKKNSIDEKALKELFEITNSYEALFNKRAQLLKKLNLSNIIIIPFFFETNFCAVPTLVVKIGLPLIRASLIIKGLTSLSDTNKTA